MFILQSGSVGIFKEFNPNKMSSQNILFLSIAILVVLALIIFLIRKNIMDSKEINPDAEDIMEEMETDKERRREKL